MFGVTRLNTQTLTQANAQWSSRPADQRFLSLPELYAVTHASRENSRARVVSTRQVEVQPASDNPMAGLVVAGQNGSATPTNWAFGQLAAIAGAPAGYLRKLPAPIVADAMNYGLRFNRQADDMGLLLTRQESGVELRAATGPAYGRVWNDDIVSALMNKVGDGRTGNFRVPGEFGKAVEVTRENTTIYGSDRDIFVFLADEENRVEMDNRRDGKPGSLARGFFVWNSEVGSQTMGAAFFLFDYVCKNRIVWGAQGYKEMRLRHTKSAPDRWLEEISPVLLEYSNASAGPIEATIRAAQERRIGDDLEAFMAKRFTKPEMTGILQAHLREESRPVETMWDAVTAVTAYARAIPNQDDRVAMERRGGALLDLVT
jgi:hypothetical protein